MKQYLLRGIGIGIIFTSIVLLIAFGGKEKSPSLSESEIIDKALELGMVTKEQYLNKTFSDDKIMNLAKDLGMYTKEEFNNKTLTDEEIIEQARELGMDFTDSVEQGGNPGEQSKGEQSTGDQTTGEQSAVEQLINDPDSKTASIVVKKGMDSITIAKMLEKVGVIDDWVDFNKYLTKKHMNVVLRIGTFVIEKGSDYETIANILTKKEN